MAWMRVWPKYPARGSGAGAPSPRLAGSLRPAKRTGALVGLGQGGIRAPSQLAQRDAGGVAPAGPQRRQPGHQRSRVCRVKRARSSSGPVRTSALAWLIVWVRSPRGAALGDHQRPDRLDGAVPALRGAGRPAGLGGPVALTASSGSDLP